MRQHACANLSREPTDFVLRGNDHPRCTAGQAQGSRLSIKSRIATFNKRISYSFWLPRIISTLAPSHSTAPLFTYRQLE